MLETALKYSHQLLKEVVQPGDTVVDATVGNGHDTAFLAELVGPTGQVYGFDVQAVAIENTKQKLISDNLEQQATLFHQGHENMDNCLSKDEVITGGIFNLGYLPRSDKHIITHGETTLQALSSLLPRLKSGGRVVVVVYYGHDGGMEEKKAVIDFSEKLPQKEYTVLSYQFINQSNQPPLLLAIEKKKSNIQK